MSTHPNEVARRTKDVTSPHLSMSGPREGARAVVLLLHGGRATSAEPARRGLAYLRMVPFARAVRSRTRADEVAVWLLRYRLRGWNGAAEDPLTDARWALDEARRLHPGAQIVLVGHSMGGRTALRLAGEPGVAGVCALAPWIEPGEPEPQSQVPIVIAHGDGDQVTDPAASAAYAARVGASFVPVPGETHALLRRPVFWTRLVTGFVASTLDVDSHAR
ncbi:alpha/beta hydrolase [Winogradskya consettensis]|uniref:Alpha/beta hydrolase n=1 Tax=Winogradskya consettensis TaxID=113560 RepID=A0A919W0M5_9ACTN|nr:alpha/beta hydrolase [Actinoplanes consettensis]